MRDPNIITMTPRWISSLHEVTRKCGPARAEGYASLLFRLRATWLVFTGRADALIWPEDAALTAKGGENAEG